MTIKVIEQTTSERNREIMKLFQQIKPLLDQGYSYVEAYSKITGISKRNLQGTAQFKHLKKYGETQGYSTINYSQIYKPSNKHGLYNVRLVKQNRQDISNWINGNFTNTFFDECINKEQI